MGRLLPDLYPDIGEITITPQARAPKRVRNPLMAPARGAKNTAVYNLHSYPTKVPPEAIAPFIEHYTRSGDVVLDPFAGSGMTGFAAGRLGRQAILNDLSVGATHLSWNVTRPCDPGALQAAAQEILRRVRPAFEHWYATEGRGDTQAVAEWVLHSEVIACVACGTRSSIWDDGTDQAAGVVRPSWPCRACGNVIARRGALAVGSIPSVVSAIDARGRFESSVTARDIARWEAIASEPIGDWYPQDPVTAEREMYLRCALHLRRIESVADFFTPRNLRALARLWSEICQWPNERERQALALAFTNTAWHGTRMRRFNARGGQRPLTGTLYIPQLSIEVNVASVFDRKIRQLCRFYSSGSPKVVAASVLRGSATKLPLEDAMVDYCFTDPPFGSNIFYGDCAIVWESWLGATTPIELEAVVNRSLRSADGGKTVDDYALLMDQAFAEIARVLKPDAWSTVVFQSTDAEVWAALRLAVERAGFDLASAGYLDKTQQSHKGYKGRAGVENVAAFDVVLNLHKPARTGRRRRARTDMQEASDLLFRHLQTLSPVGADPEMDRQRSLPFLHSLLLQAHFNGSIGLEIGEYALVRRICEERFDHDDEGLWRTRSSVAASNAT